MPPGTDAASVARVLAVSVHITRSGGPARGGPSSSSVVR